MPWFARFPTFCIHGGYGERRSGARSSNIRSRQARVSITTSPLADRAPFGPKKRDSSASGLFWPSAARRVPTASISSMKTMHWPPHLRASFFALRARKRTIRASMPMNVCANPEPGIETNGELNPVAIAFASIVLPVPDLPGRAPPCDRRSGFRGEVPPEEDDRDDARQPDGDPEDEAPGPGAAPVDDVLLTESRLLGAEQAPPRDEAADDEVYEPAKADDRAERRDERGPDAEADLVMEPEVGGRAGEQGHDGG